MAKHYAATSLTGGGSGALDKINGSLLEDGDTARVTSKALGTTYFYHLDATSGAAESSPDIIAPDTSADSKRWMLSKVEVDASSLGSAAGYDVGTGANQLPRNSDLGSASLATIGFGSGEVPTVQAGTPLQKRVADIAQASITSQIPRDDTPPQSSEGTEIAAITITPKSATSKLLIRLSGGSFWLFKSGANPAAVLALFKDSEASAIQSGVLARQANGTGVHFDRLSFEFAAVVAGTTNAITFKVRAGVDESGATLALGYNSNDTTTDFGGTIKMSISVEEIAA